MWTRKRSNPEQLAHRWKASRWEAISPLLNPSVDKASCRDENEFSWIAAVPLENRSLALKHIYELSRTLGKSVRQESENDANLNEVLSVVNRSESPCFQGKWKKCEGGMASELCRTQCPYVRGSFECDYWREALRGLVGGLSDSVEFSRHESLGHLNDACVDQLYVTPMSQRAYGPVPDEIREAVQPLVDNLNRWTASLKLVGFNEGTLFVTLVGPHYSTCKACHEQVVNELREALKPLQPAVTLRELPYAVAI